MVVVVMGGVMDDGNGGGCDRWLFIVMVVTNDGYGGGCNGCDG